MSVQTSLFLVDCKRIRKGAFSAGHQMRTVPMLASLVVNPRWSIAPAAQMRRRHLGTCHLSSRDLTVEHGRHHPCWKAAHFLPCTRPPDVMRLHRPPKRATYGPSQRHAFVATSSGHRHASIDRPFIVLTETSLINTCQLTPCTRRDSSSLLQAF